MFGGYGFYFCGDATETRCIRQVCAERKGVNVMQRSLVEPTLAAPALAMNQDVLGTPGSTLKTRAQAVGAPHTSSRSHLDFWA
jgi:hypothetical protein